MIRVSIVGNLLICCTAFYTDRLSSCGTKRGIDFEHWIPNSLSGLGARFVCCQRREIHGLVRSPGAIDVLQNELNSLQKRQNTQVQKGS
ncbi:hypothetical protein NC651_003987 [Populus alba x Populus x berolinensis]|nr:hypothetical protein NC651_003987 [Populus alba x Populus x berolinensis]